MANSMNTLYNDSIVSYYFEITSNNLDWKFNKKIKFNNYI